MDGRPLSAKDLETALLALVDYALNFQENGVRRALVLMGREVQLA